jgi:hypothetical protein
LKLSRSVVIIGAPGGEAMTPRSMFAGTIFLALAAYMLLGFLAQAVMGALPWSDFAAAGMTSLLVASIFGGLGYAVVGIVKKPLPAGTTYRPRRSVQLIAAVVVVVASGAGLWASSAKIVEQRAAAEASKRAAAERRAAWAAMTPEQRAAIAAQQKAQAEAAAKAASERTAALAAASARQKAERTAETLRMGIAGMGAAALKQTMKDPEAFELRSAYVMPNGAACYEYRGKNSFGAVLPSKAVLTSKGRLLTQENNGNTFVNAWNKECTVPGGREAADVFKRLGVV